jgi:hypothetical protein
MFVVYVVFAHDCVSFGMRRAAVVLLNHVSDRAR